MIHAHSIASFASRAAAPLALLVATSLLAPGCSESDDLATAGTKSAATSAAPLSDEPISEHRTALLDLAFNAVTKMPVVPHIKDRSRAQEAVVETCIELGQPQRAARYIEGIDNWRRGTGYAELAFYCAEHDATEQAQQYLGLARQVAEMPDEALPDVESPQGWRRDRIRAKIAKTQIRLGQPEEAAAFEVELAAPERGEVESVRARSADAATCDQQIEALDKLSTVEGFDEVEGLLKTATELHDRFYTDADRRARLEAAIGAATQKVPRQARIEVLMDLAETAVAHQDPASAGVLLQQARTCLDEAKWDLDDLTPLAARLAILRSRSGDVEGARSDVEALRSQFEQRRAEFDSIRQARALRPIAEAFAALKLTPAALELYGQAVELGAENPNARPRAEELSATCCSMAEHDVAPGPELWARMNQLGQALDSPW